MAGKTLQSEKMRTPFLELLARYLLDEGTGGEHEWHVILPNRRAGVFLRRHLARHTTNAAWMPEILTITDFTDRVSGLRPAESMDAVFVLYDVYCELKKDPESLDEFYYWGEIMVSDFDEMDKYLVEPDLMFRNITDLKEIEDPLAGLDDRQVRFIRQFWESFHAGRQTDEKRHFLENWEILPVLYRNFRERLFAGGAAYTGMQYREIVRRVKAGELEPPFPGKILVAGFNALNGCEREIFRWLRNLGSGFLWDYDEDYVKDPVNEAGRFMRRNLREFPPAVSLEDFRGIDGERDIRIFELPSDILQAKTAGRIAGQWQEHHPKAECTDMALVLCNEQLLIPVLLSLPGGTADVNVTMGYPMEGTPVTALVDALFRLQHNTRKHRDGSVTFYHGDVRTILLHPYMDPGGNHNAHLLLEKMARENMVRADREMFGSPLLRKVFQHLEKPEDMTAYLREVFMSILDVWGPESEKPLSDLHREVVFRFLLQINKLEQLLESRPGIPPVLTERLIRKITGNLRIPFEGEPLAGMQVMGILETRLLDFDHVVLLSMNEETMPAARIRQSFIPYSLRLAFGMPSREDMDAIYAYYFQRLLQRARRVDLLFNSTTEGMRTGEMSRYLHQLVYRYGLSVQRPGMQVTAREREALVVPHDAVVDGLLNRFTLGSEKESILSPSAINAYIDCSLRFYLRYLAGIGEPDEVAEEIDPAGFGTVVHDTLRFIYNEAASGAGGTIGKDALQSLAKTGRVKEVLEETFIRHHFRGRATQAIDGRNLILLKVMERIIRKVISTDLALAPFELVHTEKKFTRPLTIRAGSGEIILRIGGWIDRVDRTDDVLRVIDYKTGAARQDFSNVEALFDPDISSRNGAALQTLLYAWLVSDSFPGERITPGLYAIKSLYNDDFDPRLQMGSHGKKEPVAEFAAVEPEFMGRLVTVLEEMFDPGVPFVQTRDENKCRVCDFAALCDRRSID